MNAAATPSAARGKVPVHDLEAEAAVLATVLTTGTVDEVADTLRAEDLYAPVHRSIYTAALALAAAHEPIDAVTVAGWLRSRDMLQAAGGASAIARVVNETPDAPHVEQYARHLVDLARQRKLVAIAWEIIGEGYDGVGDVGEWLASKEQAVFDLARVHGASPEQHVREVVVDVFRELEALHASGGGMMGLSTGLRDLDGALGGLCPGELTVIAGRPGMGKSALAVGFAEAVAEQRRAAPIFSLEMPRRQVALRMACSRAGVDGKRLRRNAVTPDDWSALASASQELSRLPIWIDDTAALRPLDLRARVRRTAARAKREGSPLGVVVVDYMQLMNGRDGLAKGSNREQEISSISRSLKGLAKECEVAVVALSQLNRDVERRENKRPSMADLRESGAIEQDADAIVFVYRHEYYEPDNSDARGVAELIVAKQRQGESGTVFAHFDGPRTRFANLHPEAATRYRETVLDAQPRKGRAS